MKTVDQILQAKGRELWSIDPDASVYEALKLLAEKNIGALLVRNQEDLVGIFSERDYARRIILKGKSSKETRVREVMTEKPICVGPAGNVEECMALMTNNHIRHLPVLDGNRVMGVVSIGDIVKEIIREQQSTISHLENFITGGR
jgi:CBS domain-containing protein